MDEEDFSGFEVWVSIEQAWRRVVNVVYLHLRFRGVVES